MDNTAVGGEPTGAASWLAFGFAVVTFDSRGNGPSSRSERFPPCLPVPRLLLIYLCRTAVAMEVDTTIMTATRQRTAFRRTGGVRTIGTRKMGHGTTTAGPGPGPRDSGRTRPTRVPGGGGPHKNGPRGVHCTPCLPEGLIRALIRWQRCA